MAWSVASLKSWLQSNWRWAALNLTASAILIYVVTQGSREWTGIEERFDPTLESGKWGIRFLLISLMMTPLSTFLRWGSALKLRKSAGLWAFAFGVTHFLYYGVETWQPSGVYPASPTPWPWLAWPMQLYIALGLIALTILTALAITSNKWSMRRLGKNWKRLHRLVYCVGVVIIVHALLASTMSKRMLVRDPQVVTELRIYLGILALLLIARLPQVRARLLKVIASIKGEARPSVPVVVPAIPAPLPNRTRPQLPRQLSIVPVQEQMGLLDKMPGEGSDQRPEQITDKARDVVY